MTTRKISSTKDYRLFKRSDDNRALDVKKHKRLEQSMKEYGFLPCYPIICHRNGSKQLIVKDGQHRLAIAETLALPVHWVEDGTNFDIATINCTSSAWNLEDFARKHAASGLRDYEEGLEFAGRHHLPLGLAFAMLAGSSSFKHVREVFADGSFKIKDRDFAHSVANIYSPMTSASGAVRNGRFLDACMAVCRVQEFDPGRLLQNTERCRDKLLSFSNRDAYLLMLEEIYNFGRSKLFGLRSAAIMALRDRNPIVKNSKRQPSIDD